MIKYIRKRGSMKSKTNISLKQVKEAIKQADANINFEKVNISSKKTSSQDKTLTLTKGYINGKRPLG